MSAHNKPADALAQIGQSRVEISKALAELKPLPGSQAILSTGEHDANAQFTAQPAVRDLEGLQPHLNQLREQYAPFQLNHAPAAQSLWTSKRLENFDWRIATGDDWKNFTGVLQGKGEWESVTIPHYGEPIGKATTFYRTSFQVSEEELKDRALYLRFRGVDYKAHVFVNGALMGSHEGFFDPFEFEISSAVTAGDNTLLVRVDNDNTCLGDSQHHEAPSIDGDKIYAATNQGYDEPKSGWHHCPPGMGIYQEVLLESRPQLHITDIFVRPHQDLATAEVWIEVQNSQVNVAEIQLKLSLYGSNFDEVLFEAQEYYDPVYRGSLEEERRVMAAGPGKNFYRDSIDIPKARVWELEQPWLYQINVTLSSGKGELLDEKAQHFGMHTFEMVEEDGAKGAFRLNGKPIRLRHARGF